MLPRAFERGRNCMSQAMSHMHRCCAFLALLFWAAAAQAGGLQPLACSQGDEIRTIDYHMDVNMARLLEIQEAEMTAEAREQALEANTEQFLALQRKREKLTQECALQIRKRNEYYPQ